MFEPFLKKEQFCVLLKIDPNGVGWKRFRIYTKAFNVPLFVFFNTSYCLEQKRISTVIMINNQEFFYICRTNDSNTYHCHYARWGKPIKNKKKNISW